MVFSRKAVSFDTAVPLGALKDYQGVLRALRNRTFVLLGEATHGAHEFYSVRAEVSKRLIEDENIAAIAVEGDWPAVYRINRYVRWQSADRSAEEALSGFTRFPLWMWRNKVVQEFIEWLRQHNENLPPARQVGFYGLDMYSLYESVAEVLEYLDRVDPPASTRARQYYNCLSDGEDEIEVSRLVSLEPSCEDKIAKQLSQLRERALVYAKEGDPAAEDDQFQAEQNARLVLAAEAYYRNMFNRRKDAWNMRDTHMFETLVNLHEFLSRRLNKPARITVWEHNSHLGDARATSMGAQGQHNVGQLVREKYGEQNTYILGFTTYTGTVTAASRWDGSAYKKQVREALPDSIESVFHGVGETSFFLPTRGNRLLDEKRLQRAIGVLYLPKTERQSHYMTARMTSQFDAVVHIDTTTALEPLDSSSEWQGGEEQTFPFGL